MRPLSFKSMNYNFSFILSLSFRFLPFFTHSTSHFTQTTLTTMSTTLGFFSLPAELRLEVYRYLLIDTIAEERPAYAARLLVSSRRVFEELSVNLISKVQPILDKQNFGSLHIRTGHLSRCNFPAITTLLYRPHQSLQQQQLRTCLAGHVPAGLTLRSG